MSNNPISNLLSSNPLNNNFMLNTNQVMNEELLFQN
jgi:hypothetical protein